MSAVVLIDPKYPHNVGAALRACACYGVDDLYITGKRVPIEPYPGYRLPREERMSCYRTVTLQILRDSRPLDAIAGTPVAVEVREATERLPHFEHPDDPVYVFGPEDGSLPKGILTACHRFVRIPSRHCLNLSAAVYTVLYDREMKRQLGAPEQAYRDASFPERACDLCGNFYRGPAVYCSPGCASADAS